MQATALVWGLQFAFLTPALALMLTDLLGATTAQVGLILALYNASGFAAALIVPTWADRRGEYLIPMVVCGVLTLGLAIALMLVGTLLAATVALIVPGHHPEARPRVGAVHQHPPDRRDRRGRHHRLRGHQRGFSGAFLVCAGLTFVALLLILAAGIHRSSAATSDGPVTA